MTEEQQVLTRTFPLRLEPSGDGRTLEGCCVPYGEATLVRDADDEPTYYEVFEPGAFSRNLKAADRIELRYEHRDGITDIIGRAAELSEEATGLYGSFRVFDGLVGDQALRLVAEGVLPGLSVGFVPKRRGGQKRTAEGTIVRDYCHLAEVSLTRTPAYDRAVVTTMRSKTAMLEELALPVVADEQLERLRAIGVSV